MTPKEVSEAANKIMFFCESQKMTREVALHAILNAGTKILASYCYRAGKDPQPLAMRYMEGWVEAVQADYKYLQDHEKNVSDN